VTSGAAAWDYRALGFWGRVVGPAAAVAEVRALFPEPPAWIAESGIPDAPGPTAVLAARPEPEGGGFVVALNGADAWSARGERELVPTLEYGLTQAAVDDVGGRYVLLHGGAVARNGRALVMPAASGSGKSTLVAGLVAGGFALGSDEVAVLDPETGRLLPFARALCVKEGSRAVLAGRYPALRTAAPRYRLSGEPVWYVLPGDVRWLEAPAPVGVVVLPRYVAGGRTTLAPIARSAALPRFVEQSFSLGRHGAAGIGLVTAVLRAAECYELTIGGLDEAVALLTTLTDA
jgi:hypothetical protein